MDWIAANLGTIIGPVLVLIGVTVTGFLTYRATRGRDSSQMALDMANKNDDRVTKVEAKLAKILEWYDDHRRYDDQVWQELLKHDPTAAERIARPKSMPIY